MSTIARFRSWPPGLIRAVGASLLPATCCLCGFPGARVGLDLCRFCIDRLPANAAGGRNYPPIFSRVLIPFAYAYPIDHFVRALKFYGERRYARILGNLLADAQPIGGFPPPQCLIPVPLHAARYRERGFNQAREIARYAALNLALPIEADCLKRVRVTDAQSGLALAARRDNVRGAFGVLRPPRARHVALVDDVLTTGSTAAEAARALFAMGVEKIELWCAARTVLQDPARADSTL